MCPMVSVIIPAYNEEQTLAEILRRIHAVSLPAFDREIIICDDASTDHTSGVIASLCESYPDTKVYRSPINFGKGAAVRVGMKLATGDILLIQDADLELDPLDYPKLLAPFSDPDVSVVYGSRFLGGRDRCRGLNRMANRLLTLVTNALFGARLTDMETAYKVLRREVLDGLHLTCVRFDFEPEITARLLQAGYHIVEVPVSYTPRTVSEGKKIAWRDGWDALYTLFRSRFLS